MCRKAMPSLRRRPQSSTDTAGLQVDYLITAVTAWGACSQLGVSWIAAFAAMTKGVAGVRRGGSRNARNGAAWCFLCPFPFEFVLREPLRQAQGERTKGTPEEGRNSKEGRLCRKAMPSLRRRPQSRTDTAGLQVDYLITAVTAWGACSQLGVSWIAAYAAMTKGVAGVRRSGYCNARNGAAWCFPCPFPLREPQDERTKGTPEEGRNSKEGRLCRKAMPSLRRRPQSRTEHRRTLGGLLNRGRYCIRGPVPSPQYPGLRPTPQ